MFEYQHEDHSFRFIVTFGPRATTEGFYVCEKTTNETCEYGPMPAEFVLPFIEERKVFWQKLADRQLSRYLTDFSVFGNAELVWPPNASSPPAQP